MYESYIDVLRTLILRELTLNPCKFHLKFEELSCCRRFVFLFLFFSHQNKVYELNHTQNETQFTPLDTP